MMFGINWRSMPTIPNMRYSRSKFKFQIAQKHSITPADVLLGYLIARGLVVLPRSVRPSRIKSNLTSVINSAPKLDAIDMKTLNGLATSGKQKRFLSSGWPVDVGFDNWP